MATISLLEVFTGLIAALPATIFFSIVVLLGNFWWGFLGVLVRACP